MGNCNSMNNNHHKNKPSTDNILYTKQHITSKKTIGSKETFATLSNIEPEQIYYYYIIEESFLKKVPILKSYKNSDLYQRRLYLKKKKTSINLKNESF